MTLSYLLHEEKESVVLENAASKNLLGQKDWWFFGERLLVFGSWGIFFKGITELLI